MTNLRHTSPGMVFNVILHKARPHEISMVFAAAQIFKVLDESDSVTRLNVPLPITTFSAMPVQNPLANFLESGDILYAVCGLSVIGWPTKHVVYTLLREMCLPVVLSFFRPSNSGSCSLVMNPYMIALPEGFSVLYSRQHNTVKSCALNDAILDELRFSWSQSEQWNKLFRQYKKAQQTMSSSSSFKTSKAASSNADDEIVVLDEVDEEEKSMENEISDANFGEDNDFPLYVFFYFFIFNICPEDIRHTQIRSSRFTRLTRYTHTYNRYSDYVPQKLQIEGAARHPGDVVVSSSLGAVESPDMKKYEMMLPKKCISKHRLSLLQLESVYLAGLAHSQMLPNPDEGRTGFFLGDGAGVGKGRQVAGIIYDNIVQGRSKAIWISVSNDLFLDARRDLDDLGAIHVPLASLSKMSYKPISKHFHNKLTSQSQAQGKNNDERVFHDEPITSGCLYLTYSCLISKKSGRGKQSRMKQILNWIGKDKLKTFDGVIVFDECHRAKHVLLGKDGGTKTASAVIELQDALPNARIVYVVLYLFFSLSHNSCTHQ